MTKKHLLLLIFVTTTFLSKALAMEQQGGQDYILNDLTAHKIFKQATLNSFSPVVIEGKYRCEVEGQDHREPFLNQKETAPIPIDEFQTIENLKEPPNSQNRTAIDPAPMKQTEKRSRVEKTQEFPYSTSVFLEMDFGDRRSYIGSGVMIGPRHILTAGHNVYENDAKRWAKSIDVYPGADQTKDEKKVFSPFGGSAVVRAFVPKNYFDGNDKNDLAVLIMEKELGKYTGWASIVAPLEGGFKNVEFYVTGYPGEKETGQLWEMKGAIKAIEPLVLHHEIPTTRGQSGSPLWMKTEPPAVSGIHVRKHPSGLWNEATRINRGNLEWIVACLKDDFSVQAIIPVITNIPDSLIQWINQKEWQDNTLQELDLRDNQIGDADTIALASNTTWTKLQELDLGKNRIRDAGAIVLARNITWTQLQTLILHSNQIGVAGVKALASNTSWTKLQTLYLLSNQFGDAGVKALASNTSWTKLQELYLGRNKIGDAGAKALASNTAWTQLQMLELDSNQIGVAGVKALASNTSWTKLQTLYLGRNKIGDVGAKALASNTSWTKLQTLYLGNNKIGDVGLNALVSNTAWTQLQTLELADLDYEYER